MFEGIKRAKRALYESLLPGKSKLPQSFTWENNPEFWVKFNQRAPVKTKMAHTLAILILNYLPLLHPFYLRPYSELTFLEKMSWLKFYKRHSNIFTRPCLGIVKLVALYYLCSHPSYIQSRNEFYQKGA